MAKHLFSDWQASFSWKVTSGVRLRRAQAVFARLPAVPIAAGPA
jgi:hypothetical protein